jgi:hypothetical protein
VLACYVVNASAENSEGVKKCGAALEDYYECLHHKKEVSCFCPCFCQAYAGCLGELSLMLSAGGKGAGTPGGLPKGRIAVFAGQCTNGWAD